MIQKAPGPRPGPQSSQVSLTPKDIYAIVRRHIWLIMILTVVGVIGGVGAWLLLSKFAPKYTARTYIRVLPPVDTPPTEIRSPIVGKDIQYGHRLSIASLMKQQSMLARLIEKDTIKNTKWFRSFGSETNKAKRIVDSIDDLKKHLGVSAHRDAEFVTVSMTCGNARESADIVNEMVDLFIGSQRDTKVSEVQQKLVELEKRRNALQDELSVAERALDQVREQSGITDLEARNFRDTITLRLDTIEEEERDLMLTVSQLQGNISNLEDIVNRPIGAQVENQIERDPTLSMLTQQLFNAKTALSQLQTKFGESHRTVREIKERVEDLQQRRDIRKQEIGNQTRQANLEDAKDQLSVFAARLKAAEAQREQATSQKNTLDRARVEYDKRSRTRDQLQDALNEIKDLIEQRRIQAEDPSTPKVMKVGNAPEPLEMSFPKAIVLLPAGTFLGLMCGVGLAFLIELLNDLLRTPRDVVRFINAPLLGVVPDADEDRQLKGVDLCHVVRLAPYSILSEAYRQMSINLRLSATGAENKVIFISSCGADDGKTAVAINLATTLISEGRRVLLIDANFWRSMLHKAFPASGLDTRCDEKVKSEFGLSNLLTGKATVEQVIRPSGIDQFDIIDAGPAPLNPTELIASQAMAQLIEQARSGYDHIIIDGPPVLLVSGAKVLAQRADGTILVFNAGLTRRGAAQRAARELTAVRVNLLGSVLLAAKALKGGYFQEQYRSYQRYNQPILSS